MITVFGGVWRVCIVYDCLTFSLSKKENIIKVNLIWHIVPAFYKTCLNICTVIRPNPFPYNLIWSCNLRVWNNDYISYITPCMSVIPQNYHLTCSPQTVLSWEKATFFCFHHSPNSKHSKKTKNIFRFCLLAFSQVDVDRVVETQTKNTTEVIKSTWYKTCI